MDEHRTGPVPGRSANDRYKDLWENRVAWSTVCAVALHAAVIGLGGFHHLDTPAESAPARGQMVMLPTSLGEGVGLEGRAAPVARPEEDPTDLPQESSGGVSGPEEGGAGDADQARDLWAAAAERLGRGGLFEAEIVEMDDPGRESGEIEGDSLTVEGLDSLDVLAGLSDGDSLGVEMDLDRLTEIRPELAVMIPSLWILLRNPSDVERFLRRSYGRWSLDPDEPGSVTVTVWIDDRGSVEWAEVSKSSGRQNLDEAALELFNEVVAFRPARQEGVAVSGSATFALLFPW